MIIPQLFTNFGVGACSGGGFLSFPTWYKYLPANTVATTVGGCAPTISNLNDVWLIVAAIVEILLRIAALVAVGFVIFGGFQYLTSQAEPAKVAKARQTIIDALVGVSIAMLAAGVINFLAESIK
jgi:hypothetical protein